MFPVLRSVRSFFPRWMAASWWPSCLHAFHINLLDYLAWVTPSFANLEYALPEKKGSKILLAVLKTRFALRTCEGFK